METIVVPAIRADMEFILYFYRNWLWCLVFQVFAPLFIINAISFAGSILQIEPFISPLLINRERLNLLFLAVDTIQIQ